MVRAAGLLVENSLVSAIRIAETGALGHAGQKGEAGCRKVGAAGRKGESSGRKFVGFCYPDSGNRSLVPGDWLVRFASPSFMVAS